MINDQVYNINTLENGFSVIKVPTNAKSLTVALWVKSGSANETKHHGIFHFIEHMFFKGTDNRSALDIAKEVESLGGYSNAFTSKEYTAYYIKSLGEYGNKTLSILADMFFNSTFDKNEIERERKVIKEEIDMIQDDPSSLIYDLFFENVLSNYPLSHPIAGTHASVSNIGRGDFIDTLDRFYTPKNCFAVVVGDLSKLNSAQFNDLFSSWKNDNKIKPVQSGVCKAGIFKHSKDLNQVNFILGFPAFSKTDDRIYALKMFNIIFGGSMSSRLFQEIREKRGLVYSINSSYEGFMDNGIVYINGGTNKDKFDETISLVKKEIKKVKADGITAEELERAKRYFKGIFLISMESNEALMQHAAISYIYHNKIKSVSEIIKKVESINITDVNNLANELLDDNNSNLTCLGNWND